VGGGDAVAHDPSREQRFSREGSAAPGPAVRAGDGSRGVATGEGSSRYYWLFLIPFFGVFLPWIYNTRDPELFGMPFFYWYQMAWVPLSVLITLFVYQKTKGTVR
jgi:hypothetical protein